MTYITAALTIVVTLAWCRGDYATTYVKENTSVVTLKQGRVKGVVVAFRTNHKLPPVSGTYVEIGTGWRLWWSKVAVVKVPLTAKMCPEFHEDLI